MSERKPLSPPPIPAFVDLRHYRDMPLEVQTLLDSTIAGVGDAEIFRCAVLLWCKSWQQVPCGSLEDDDSTLARACGLGRDLKTWRRMKDQVLRGFRKASDGRLYHWKVCAKAAEAWNSTAQWSWNKACDALRKVNKGRKDAGQEPMPMPEKPPKVSCGWGKDGPLNGDGSDDQPGPVSGGNGCPPPIISGGGSAGIPAENAGREEEGKGREKEESSLADSSTVAEPARNPPPFLKRGGRSGPVPPDWQPSEATVAQLRTSRPDLTDDVIAQRTVEFHTWGAANNINTFNPDALWLGFMVKTHVKQSASRSTDEDHIDAGIRESLARRHILTGG